uniref:AlNc14C12G1440 protein n=1 Tax=Albugo laibachii Nc14 TaxID=890382 RepID=F0W363_9STRA|nr:AlNc14C12G1440 [Albugo laibachii Nc14]|eukprot:CCA15503.1 AlNc14C12G1440 [Albugo laibachii Nc14]
MPRVLSQNLYFGILCSFDMRNTNGTASGCTTVTIYPTIHSHQHAAAHASSFAPNKSGPISAHVRSRYLPQRLLHLRCGFLEKNGRYLFDRYHLVGASAACAFLHTHANRFVFVHVNWRQHSLW